MGHIEMKTTTVVSVMSIKSVVMKKPTEIKELGLNVIVFDSLQDPIG